MRRITGLLVVLLLCALFVPGTPAAGKKVKTKDLLLPAKFTEITEEQKTLTEVPGAEGAPAVVLLEGRLVTWDEDLVFKRIHSHRRIKILTEAGIEDHGDYSLTLIGDWRVKEVHARTIVPDGTIVDAKESIFHEKSDSGDQVVRVAFPRVEVGAILDLYIEYTSGPWFVLPWRLQESIPVLDSRFIMQPPLGLRYRTVVLRLPPEANQPLSVPYGAGRKAFIWRFENVPALPDVAFLPPVDDISQKLVVIVESYKSASQFMPIASDWKSFIDDTGEYWDDWMKSGHSKADALARQVAGDKSTPMEKAEAIRLALRDRVNHEYIFRGPRHDGPDEVLEAGSGSSADVAGLAAAMLRAVGVHADLAAIRRRSDGIIPVEIPVPALLNDLLVRIPGGEPVYFSPVSNIPVGQLPWDCTGLLAVPYDRKSDQPAIIPDPKPEDIRTVRKADVTVADDGSMEGESTFTYQGVAAEWARRSYEDLDDDARKLRLQDDLRTWVDDATVTSFEFQNIDDATKDLVIKSTWEVSGYATMAGKRLVVNPNLFARADASDWAPEARVHDVNLGYPHETVDEVSLTFPTSATGLQVTATADLNAGPAGAYKSSCTRSGSTITNRREMRLNMYRFPANAYAGLKRWFTAIAEADDNAVVATMP